METQDSGLLSLTQLTPVDFDKKKLPVKIKRYEEKTGETLSEECKKFKYVKFWDDGSFFRLGHLIVSGKQSGNMFVLSVVS